MFISIGLGSPVSRRVFENGKGSDTFEKICYGGGKHECLEWVQNFVLIWPMVGCCDSGQSTCMEPVYNWPKHCAGFRILALKKGLVKSNPTITKSNLCFVNEVRVCRYSDPLVLSHSNSSFAGES